MNDGPILLIEDNPDDRELTLRALARFCADLSVIALKDCSEVSELLEERGRFARAVLPKPPSLILLDLKMPQVDGISLLRRLRLNESTQLVPVVVLSSSRERRDVRAAYQAGANGYVPKPVEFDQFIQQIRFICQYWLHCNQH
jgi:two-component system, response regulator